MKSLHKVIDLIEIISDSGSIGTRQLAAKAGFGVLIYFIARAKTQQDAVEGISPEAVPVPV